ncbi:MAG: bifunctional phosphopantothenoylcysteine decarboxylase/phosphopantothenate--cysteine ligase CoaBC [Gammaproteobacteria bacterium]
MFWHKNKRFLVGVSGGIAAYKSPQLVRRLLQRGCEVRVAMTRAACEFITPLTMQAVSGHPVHLHFLDAEAESGMGHIELARWAEQLIIAPASADFLARLAQGRADDLLSAVALASEAEIAVAPAMNRLMWQHAATRHNLATLAARGVRIIGPGAGDQACGESGPGRMSEPEEIAAALAGDARPRLLDGVETLITAGPTWEALDPVRGLSNRSSGKMGFAMAQAALDFGARVTLISGPVSLPTPHGARRIDVISARDMSDAVMTRAAKAGLFIAVAAVADYRPREIAANKIKKTDEHMRIELVKNPDILATVAALKPPPFTIGFAAETENAIANARQKCIAKNADVIAVNNVADGAAFGGEENSVTLVCRGGGGGGDCDGDGGRDGGGKHGAGRGGDGGGKRGDYRDGGEITLAKTDKYLLAVRIIEHIAPLRKRAA